MSTSSQNNSVNPGLAAAMSFLIPGLGQIAQLRIFLGFAIMVAYVFTLWIFWTAATVELGSNDGADRIAKMVFMASPLLVIIIAVRDAALYRG